MSGPQAFFSQAEQGGLAAAEGSDLAERLLLVRASNMTMLRLQRAMERRDRAIALQAMDELVELDDRIAAILELMPPSAALEVIARDVEELRSALRHEKFSLAVAVLLTQGGAR